MDVVEQLVRSFARRTTQNGHVVLITNGHAALVAAFQHLGWSDPYPEIPPKPEPKPAPVLTKATLEDTERAVLPGPKGRSGVRS